jgi:hypothetical protein
MTSLRVERPFPPAAVCLAVTVAAIVVFLQAGENQALGPLDLETADRLALALWISAPIVGGLVSRRLDNRALLRAALFVGLSVGLVIALFPAAGTGDDTCWLSLPTVPMGDVLGRAAVGSLVGGGMALALVLTGLSARRPIAAAPRIVLAAAVNLAGSLAAYELFYGGVRCLQ